MQSLDPVAVTDEPVRIFGSETPDANLVFQSETGDDDFFYGGPEVTVDNGMGPVSAGVRVYIDGSAGPIFAVCDDGESATIRRAWAHT